MSQPNLQEPAIQRTEPPYLNPDTQDKTSNSEISFNEQSKKQKSKSFNRKPNKNEEQLNSIINIIHQLQYSLEMRNGLRNFCEYDQSNLIKLSMEELYQQSEKELKRIGFVKQNNLDIKRWLARQSIQNTDNQLSLIAITFQAKSLIKAHFNQTNLDQFPNDQSIAKAELRQYETILLEVEKSDQIIKNFINTHLKLIEPSNISIIDCKKFFKSQAYIMSQSSDRIILSRRTLCEIIIFLCRRLQGSILAYDDIYEYQEEEYNLIEIQDKNKIISIQQKNSKIHQVTVQNLDQSFSEQKSQHSYHSSRIGENPNTYQNYCINDLGKKVKQLAGICEQIPQLQAFTRTLKFSKITLESRENFFKIVDVLIALHHKIGYLSRNKPTLLRQMESIQKQLGQVYQVTRQFVETLDSDAPHFCQIKFKESQEHQCPHQMTQMISNLRTDLEKLAKQYIKLEKSSNELYDETQLIKALVQAFCQSINEGDELIWKECINKHLSKNLNEDENHTINLLSQCFNFFSSQIKINHKNQEQLQTEKNLEAQVLTLVNDYEQLKLEHQDLENKYNFLLELNDQLSFDKDERDKMIENLTTAKVVSEKREKTFRDQLFQAQQIIHRWEIDRVLFEEQLNRTTLQHQKIIKEMVYDHQSEVKQLVDKITALERSKMDILNKYESQCGKSIRLLQDGSSSSIEIQSLKDKLDKKIKQSEQLSKKYKDSINSLEKQSQQLKNQKSLIQNKLQFAEKNKNKLMEKLEQANFRYDVDIRELSDKNQDKIASMKQAQYRLEKQLEKQKRKNDLLSEQNQQLKRQYAVQIKNFNQYRQKVVQMNSLQVEYESLTKQYERLKDNYHKLENNCENYKQKVIDNNKKEQQLLKLLSIQNDQNKKLQKKIKEIQNNFEETLTNSQLIDSQFKQNQKENKLLLKKIYQLEQQIQTHKEDLLNKDKNHSLLLGKSQTKFQQLILELKQDLDKERKNNQQQSLENQKMQRELRSLERQLREQKSQFEQKELEYVRTKNNLDRKIKDKLEQIRILEEKNKQLDDQTQNQSQGLKSEKHLLEIRLAEFQTIERQKDELKRKLDNMHQNQNQLKDKVQNLQNQVKNLYQQIQKLKNQMKQKDRQIQIYYEKYNKSLINTQNKQIQQKYQEYKQKNKDFNLLKEQIIIQKHNIINQNQILHQENNQLQQQIQKLRDLNQALQINIQKISLNSYNVKDDFANNQNQLKQIISNHLITITSLENSIKAINAEKQQIRKNYDEVQQKLQLKCRLLAEKDNLIHQNQLQNSNLTKLVKELKVNISNLEGTIEGLNQTIQKLKNSKIKNLENQINLLTLQNVEWKKKQEQARFAFSDLQTETEKLKKDTNRKIQALKEEKLENEEQFQNQIKKLVNQHELNLQALQNRIRNQTQNESNKLLIKEKQAFNNLTIQKMEELGELQRKYQKLMREERSEKSALQEQLNKMDRELHELKRNKNIKDANIEEKSTAFDELQKIKTQHEALKRQFAKQSQENNWFISENQKIRQQYSMLLSKSLESDSKISLMSSKLTLVTQNYQIAQKSIDELRKVELQAVHLQRQLQKLKNKSNSDDLHINEYKNQVLDMENNIKDLESKLNGLKIKEFELIRSNTEAQDKLKIMANQNDDISQKLNEAKQKNLELIKNIATKEESLQKIQNQLLAVGVKINEKQSQQDINRQKIARQKAEIEQKLGRISSDYSAIQKKCKQLQMQCQQKESELNQQRERYFIQVRQLENQLNQSQINLRQSSLLKEELSKVKTYAFQIEDSKNRTQAEIIKIKGDQLAILNQNQYLKNSINQLNTQISKLTSRIMEFQYQNKIIFEENSQLTENLSNVFDETKKENQKQIQIQKNKLIQQFENQKKAIIQNHQAIIASLNFNLLREQAKSHQITLNYNKIILDTEQKLKLLQKLRKQNLQLSDHCKKCQEKIQNLQIDYQPATKFGLKTQQKNLVTPFPNSQHQQNNKCLSQSLNQLVIENQTLKRTLSELQKQSELLKISNTKYQQALSQIKNQNAVLSSQEAEKLRQLQALVNQFKIVSTRLVQAQDFNHWSENERINLHRKLIQLTENEKNYLTQIQNYQLQTRNLQTYIQNLQKLQNQTQTKNSEELIDVNKLKNQITLATQQILKLQNDIKKKDQDIQKYIASFHQQKSTLWKDNQVLSKQVQSLNSQFKGFDKQRQESQKQMSESSKDQINIQLKNELESANKQINNLRAMILPLQKQNQLIKNDLNLKQKVILQMKKNLQKINQTMEKSDNQLQIAFKENFKQNKALRELTAEKDQYGQILRSKQIQINILKQTTTRLEEKINQLYYQIQRFQSQTPEHILSHSKSSINLINKTYSYQGGQVTAAQLFKLEEQNKKLIRQIEIKEKTIEENRSEIKKLSKEIKILKELLSEAKTINIKGYTRITNPNNKSLNTKGIQYTEYDVKEIKAKVQLLEKNIARYQDRETELLSEIQKYKFRQRHQLSQIRILEDKLKNAKTISKDYFDEIQEFAPSQNPQKKTSYDKILKSQTYQPQSSTYRLQSGIDVIQRKVNMTKKQFKKTQRYFLRTQGQQLRKIIERLSNEQQIFSRKIDSILYTSQKSSRQELSQVLTTNQFNLSTTLINQIRQLIHQNKALIQTLKSLKQYRQDVNLLIKQYINPQLLTEYVYRILTYFSTIEEGSIQANQIREQLNFIRKQNMSGFYFDALEEYTKFILDNNAIQIYKEQLRQKARQLIHFKEKFQAMIDAKLDENQKLLNKSDSRSSLLNRSKAMLLGNSRGRNSQDNFRENSDSKSKDCFPVTFTQKSNLVEGRNSEQMGLNKVINPFSNLNSASNLNSVAINLNSASNLNSAANQNPQKNTNSRPLLSSISASPIASTSSDRNKLISWVGPTTSYNNTVVGTPIQSASQSRFFSTTPAGFMGNSYAAINSSNIKILGGNFEKNQSNKII